MENLTISLSFLGAPIIFSSTEGWIKMGAAEETADRNYLQVAEGGGGNADGGEVVGAAGEGQQPPQEENATQKILDVIKVLHNT